MQERDGDCGGRRMMGRDCNYDGGRIIERDRYSTKVGGCQSGTATTTVNG